MAAEPAPQTDDAPVDDLDIMLTKKKKKKKFLSFDEENNKENSEEGITEAPKNEDDVDFDFTSMKKKRRGKSKKANLDVEKIIGEDDNEESIEEERVKKLTWMLKKL